jgi:hypothetical protein
MNRADVRVVERGEQARFAREPGATLGVISEVGSTSSCDVTRLEQ